MLLVAACPNDAANLILGIPFINAVGMIADFVDIVCQAKHLLCKPFPIDFRVLWNLFVSLGDAILPHIPSNLTRFIKPLVCLKTICLQGGRSPSPYPCAPEHRSRSSDHTAKKVSFRSCWVPPIKSAEYTNGYLHQILVNLGYLLVLSTTLTRSI